MTTPTFYVGILILKSLYETETKFWLVGQFRVYEYYKSQNNANSTFFTSTMISGRNARP